MELSKATYYKVFKPQLHIVNNTAVDAMRVLLYTISTQQATDDGQLRKVVCCGIY